MTKPKEATYNGPLQQLEGCKALVRPGPNPETLEAQFLSVGPESRSREECAGKKDITQIEMLMFGWSQLPAQYFETKRKKDKPTKLGLTGC